MKHSALIKHSYNEVWIIEHSYVENYFLTLKLLKWNIMKIRGLILQEGSSKHNQPEFSDAS